jgi:hypothetical protein
VPVYVAEGYVALTVTERIVSISCVDGTVEAEVDERTIYIKDAV